MDCSSPRSNRRWRGPCSSPARSSGSTYDGARYPLSTHEFGDGVIAPDGYRYLESFRLEGSLPVWTFAVADALIERRVWMEYGANTTFVTYRLLRGSRSIDLEITPLVTYRSFHALASGQGWSIGVDAQERGATIRAYEGAAPFSLRSDRAEFRPGGAWWWDFQHRAEAERGLADRGDLFAPGAFLRAAGSRRDGRADLLDRAGDRISTPRPPRRRPGAAAIAAGAGRRRSTPTRSSSNSCSPPTSFSSPGRCRTTRMAAASSPATTGSTTGAATR